MTNPQQQLWPIQIAILAVIILLLLCTAPSAAIGVMGAKYVGTIAPGGTDTHVVTIDIGAGEPATDVGVTVAGFGQNPSGIYSPLSPANDLNPYSARSFITLDNSTIHLQPGTEPERNGDDHSSAECRHGRQVCDPLYLFTPGEQAHSQRQLLCPYSLPLPERHPHKTGSILQIDTGTLTTGQPITITTTFKNTGNYHYYNGINEVNVTDSNGNFIANASTTPLIYAIIPGNTVQFVAHPNVTNLQPGNLHSRLESPPEWTSAG